MTKRCAVLGKKACGSPLPLLRKIFSVRQNNFDRSYFANENKEVKELRGSVVIATIFF